MTTEAMIISLGGSPQPVITSIIKYRPLFISFLVSHDTCNLIADIEKTLTQDHEIHYKKEITLVDDVNELMHCYQKAEEAVSRILRHQYNKDKVIVDYTGGTKNMSVALALAAVTHGFSFSYVGGKDRTKDGIGIVKDGSEEVYQSINPWDFLALDEKKKIAAFINVADFKAAKDLLEELASKAVKNRAIFRKTGLIVELLYQWDLFNYKVACQIYRRKELTDLLDSDDPNIKDFADHIFKLQSFLEVIVKNEGKPHKNLVLDIFANAERRYKQGKIDDAILRLYRLVEMMAQERLMSSYQIDSSNVDLGKVPKNLREEFETRNADGKTGQIKIGLNASYRLLKELGDGLGTVFFDNKHIFENLQSARNLSYLAHGFSSPKPDTYSNLKRFILGLGFFQEDEAPVFPELSWH
ncbi:MAG: TIGR02710 family CRISPR-associated CARF protein [Dissulfuribacterales bacterium]